ncbi:MAG TPA: 30S ribosomal protein S4 [Actinomycetota bacterium]|jgi:small subunit ribosomal protein S4|nr:30S ribosomal protein S4 [Actinomycetota bacterium]
MLKVGPRHRICRRVGAAVCGRPNCPSGRRPYPPGQHGRGRRRLTEYQLRLLEKQKLRAIYGIGERQFRRYFERATRRKGVTGAELLKLLETRVDALALRLGFALSMRAARQLVSHGHVKLNGRRIDVPSAAARPGDNIELDDKGRNLISVREALEITPEPPPYLEREGDGLGGTLTRWPERHEIPLPVEVNERLIVEYYS